MHAMHDVLRPHRQIKGRPRLALARSWTVVSTASVWCNSRASLRKKIWAGRQADCEEVPADDHLVIADRAVHTNPKRNRQTRPKLSPTPTTPGPTSGSPHAEPCIHHMFFAFENTVRRTRACLDYVLCAGRHGCADSPGRQVCREPPRGICHIDHSAGVSVAGRILDCQAMIKYCDA